MERELVMRNPPKVLVPLAKKWHGEGRKFYLGPENIFTVNCEHVDYHGAKDVPKEYGSWSLCTSDNMAPSYRITAEDMREIAAAFSTLVKIERCCCYVGDQCNLNCIFCPIHGGDKSGALQSFAHECDVNELHRRLDIIARLGIPDLGTETHGDLFAYRYWREYLRYASERRFRIVFSTNGIALNDEKCRFLAEHCDIKWMGVSINAATEETYGKICGIANYRQAFANADQAPLLLRKYGIPATVSIVWCEANHSEIGLFIEKWTKAGFYVQVIPEIKSVNPSEGREDGLATLHSLPANACDAAYSKSIYVSPSGRLAPCCGAPQFMGDDSPFNIPVWMLDDKTPENIIQMRESFRTANIWDDVCRRCNYFSRVVDSCTNVSVKAFGAMGNITPAQGGFHMIFEPRHGSAVHAYEGQEIAAAMIAHESVKLRRKLCLFKNSLRAITPPVIYDGLRYLLKRAQGKKFTAKSLKW
ncbi:MAG: radical SAM protein [Planctomycetota bacterium]|jgi:MoaA/NifB/PqqE/SkfB family radical SAM enzyme|nr:radical SAM protein [Planctomycetota bacterium]